jgi:hypothetical protein
MPSCEWCAPASNRQQKLANRHARLSRIPSKPARLLSVLVRLHTPAGRPLSCGSKPRISQNLLTDSL